MSKAGHIVKWSERKGKFPRHNRPAHKMFVTHGRGETKGPTLTYREHNKASLSSTTPKTKNH